MKTYDVTALGELLIDFTENGISEQGNPILEANPGGAPCNVLSMLVKLGHKGAFIGKIGADMFGDQLACAIREVGIDTTGLKIDEQVHTTLAFVHTLEGGEREFSFYRNPGADMMLSEHDLDETLIKDSKFFHFGSLSMTDEVCRKATRKAIEIAEKSGLSPEYVQESAELSPKKGLFAYAFAGRDITGKSIEDMVYEAQRKVILELADRESCVIIGRNADYILKDRDDVLNVFIHGDMPEKTQRIMNLYNVGEKEAVKMMADTDKRRMTNYNFYTEQKWGKASNYTLSLNSSQLGYDRCEKIIMECI